MEPGSSEPPRDSREEPSCDGAKLSPAARAALVVVGSVFLVVGAVGVVVPILPTTPFLLLAALCYSRGSKRWYRWLVGNRVFGRYLSDYLCGKGVPLRVKVVALVFLWGVIGASAVFFVDRLWVRILLIAVAVGVTVHILLVKGKTDGHARDR